jgi:hypothetical protein
MVGNQTNPPALTLVIRRRNFCQHAIMLMMGLLREPGSVACFPL